MNGRGILLILLVDGRRRHNGKIQFGNDIENILKVGKIHRPKDGVLLLRRRCWERGFTSTTDRFFTKRESLRCGKNILNGPVTTLGSIAQGPGDRDDTICGWSRHHYILLVISVRGGVHKITFRGRGGRRRRSVFCRIIRGVDQGAGQGLGSLLMRGRPDRRTVAGNGSGRFQERDTVQSGLIQLLHMTQVFLQFFNALSGLISGGCSGFSIANATRFLSPGGQFRFAGHGDRGFVTGLLLDAANRRQVQRSRRCSYLLVTFLWRLSFLGGPLIRFDR